MPEGHTGKLGDSRELSPLIVLQLGRLVVLAIGSFVGVEECVRVVGEGYCGGHFRGRY